MTQIDVSLSDEVQLAWKSSVSNTNGFVSGESRTSEGGCAKPDGCTSKGRCSKSSLNKESGTIDVLRVLQNSAVASDLLETLKKENEKPRTSDEGARNSETDDLTDVVDETQTRAGKSADYEKSFRLIRSYGNIKAQRSLRMLSEKWQPCICASHSDDGRTSLCGWRRAAHNVAQEATKSVRKAKSYMNVYHRLVHENRQKGPSFQHYAEPSRYMDEYRQRFTVGNVCNYNTAEPPKFGLNLIDPYAVKVKNICSVADTFDLTALVPYDKDRSCLELRDLAPRSAKSSASAKKYRTVDGDDRRSERGSAGPRSCRTTIPNLAPVRKCKSPKETMSPRSQDQSLPVDRYLDLQQALPKIRNKTRISPDPISGSKFEKRLTAESTTQVQRPTEHPSKTSDHETSLQQSNTEIAVAISRIKAMKKEIKTVKMSDFFTTTVNEESVHPQVRRRISDESEHLRTDGDRTSLRATKTSKQKHCTKKAKCEKRPCARLISVTLGDIGLTCESDVENVKREESTCYRLKKSRSKKQTDVLSPAAR